MGSWRPRRPQTGVPDGLVWADPPRVFVLLEMKHRDQTPSESRKSVVMEEEVMLSSLSTVGS